MPLNMKTDKVTIYFRDTSKPHVIELVSNIGFDPNLRTMVLTGSDGMKTFIPIDAARYWEVQGGVLIS